MAGYKGHVAGGAVAAAAYTTLILVAPGDYFNDAKSILNSWQAVAGLFVVAMLFGLWPDVDTNSKGQDLYIGIAFLADVALILSGRFEAAAFLGLIAMTPIIGKHRGWTHSRWAMLIVPLPIVLVPWLYSSDLLSVGLVFYGAAVLGYASHLHLDGVLFKRPRRHGHR